MSLSTVNCVQFTHNISVLTICTNAMFIKKRNILIVFTGICQACGGVDPCACWFSKSVGAHRAAKAGPMRQAIHICAFRSNPGNMHSIRGIVIMLTRKKSEMLDMVASANSLPSELTDDVVNVLVSESKDNV